MQMLIRTSLLASLVAGLCPVYAQESNTLDPITVSADLRNSNEQELAASTTVLTTQQLQDQGSTHFGDVLLQTPNVNYSGQSSRPRHIQIRGMGERDEYTGAPNASVGFAVDDIDFSGIGMTGSLFDVKQVEVLRGSQSTRYGASALAGLINIQSNEPTAESEQMIEATAGGDSLRELGIVSSGAFNKEANSPQYRFSMFKHTSNGFRKNAYLGRSDTNERDELSMRGKLRFFPSSVTTVDVTMMHSDMNNGYDAFSLNNSFTTLSDQPGKDTQLSNAGAVKVTHKGNPNFTLVSTTTLANSDMRYGYDGDWTNKAYWLDKGYSFYNSYNNEKKRVNLSQELRFISTPSSRIFNNTTDWLVGFYGSKLDEKNTNFTDGESAAINHITDLTNDPYSHSGEYLYYKTTTTTDYTLSKLATFAQLDHTMSKTTKLSGGLRIEQHEANFNSSNAADKFNPSETLWGGNLSISEQLDKTHNAYALIAKGYKAGGFNTAITDNSANLLRFNSEQAINYEIGLKSNYASQQLKTKISVFYIDRKNPQFDGYRENIDKTYSFFTENFESAKNYGAEAEFNWQPQARWQLFGSAGLLKTEVSGTPINPSLDNLTTRGTQSHAPNYQVMLGTQYRTAQGYFARVDANAVDSFYFDNVHNFNSNAYTLWNARIGYQAKDWEVFLWGRNITDEKYATRGYSFGNNPDYTTENYVRLGDRQQFGLTTRIFF
jgi:outer membrane receptor protein involved in Fe transport